MEKEEDEEGENAATLPRPRPLLLPVQVEVSALRGLFSPTPLLDFGIVLNDGPSKVLDIRLISSLNRTIEIDSIRTEPRNPALKVNWEGSALIKASGDEVKRSVSVGRATFWGSGVPQKGPGRQVVSGQLLLSSRGGFHSLSIPYRVEVLSGSLKEDPQEASFFSGHKPPLEQKLSLKNTFPFPLAIYNVSIPKAVRKAFSASLISSPIILGGGGSRGVVLTLRYHGGLKAPTSSFIRLSSNISTFDIPIHVFHGSLRLTLYSMEQELFDFGVLEEGERRSILFALTNENPVPIPVNQLRQVMDTYTSLRLLGMEEGNETILSANPCRESGRGWREDGDLLIPPHSFAVLEYSVLGPSEKALYQSSITFQTPYEVRPLPVSFSIEEGTLVSVPERVVFLDAFPGKLSEQKLQVYSSFQRKMALLRLSTLSHDPRFFFQSFGDGPPPVLEAGQMSLVGRVFFLPVAACQDDCYVGMPLHTNAGRWFVYGLKLPANLAEIDVYLYEQQRAKWKALKEAGEDSINATLVVDTTDVKHFQIPARGQLVWPRLIPNAALHFPLTALGNFSIINVTMENPSSLPVVVQLLPLTIYPDPELLLELLKGDFPEPLTDVVEYNETLMFTLRDTELFNLPKDSPVPGFRQEVEEILGGVSIPRFTLSMLLPPGRKVRVRVGFMPKDLQLRSSLLLVRNNLTVLEPVTLYGRGAVMGMKMNGRAPGRSDRPLLIQLREQHLSDCDNLHRQNHRTHTSLTVWHPFYMLNSGEVPFTVTGINISNQACENHGFRILNCEPFHLRPNQTREIKIAFTADFTSEWTEAALQVFVWGNGSASIYPIAASIPPERLGLCHKALPRPTWENMLYYISVLILLSSAVCSLSVAFIEGDRIVRTALIRDRHPPSAAAFTPFDLNSSPPSSSPHSQVTQQQTPPEQSFSSPSSSSQATTTSQHSAHHASSNGIRHRRGQQTTTATATATTTTTASLTPKSNRRPGAGTVKASEEGWETKAKAKPSKKPQPPPPPPQPQHSPKPPKPPSKQKATKKDSSASSKASSAEPCPSINQDSTGTENPLQTSSASPYNFAAKLTADVVSQSRQSGSESGSDSGAPEWDSIAPLSSTSPQDFDSGLELMSAATAAFAAEEAQLSSSSSSPASSSISSDPNSRRAKHNNDNSSSNPNSFANPRLNPRHQLNPSSFQPETAPSHLPLIPTTSPSARAVHRMGKVEWSSGGLESPIGAPPGLSSPPIGSPRTPQTPPTGSGIGWSPLLPSSSSSSSSTSPLSIMQKLQAERKALEAAYLQRRREEEDWPMPPPALNTVPEDLWDEEAQPWAASAAAAASSSASPSPSLISWSAASSQQKRSPAPTQTPPLPSLQRPNFKWNVAAQPFRPIQAGSESGGESSPRPDSQSPAPLLDPSILRLGPSVSPPLPLSASASATPPPPPSNLRDSPAAIGNSLFAGISDSIWATDKAEGKDWPDEEETPSLVSALIASASPTFNGGQGRHPASPLPLKREEEETSNAATIGNQADSSHNNNSAKRPRSAKSKNSSKKKSTS